MSDEKPKVWEESWDHCGTADLMTGSPTHNPVARFVCQGPDRCDIGDCDLCCARADLAAAAPEMARLLLAIANDGWCNGVDTIQVHAILRKAGVLTWAYGQTRGPYAVSCTITADPDEEIPW